MIVVPYEKWLELVFFLHTDHGSKNTNVILATVYGAVSMPAHRSYDRHIKFEDSKLEMLFRLKYSEIIS